MANSNLNIITNLITAVCTLKNATTYKEVAETLAAACGCTEVDSHEEYEWDVGGFPVCGETVYANGCRWLFSPESEGLELPNGGFIDVMNPLNKVQQKKSSARPCTCGSGEPWDVCQGDSDGDWGYCG